MARELIDATPGVEATAERDGVETTRRLRAAAPDLVMVLISLEAEADLPSSVRNCGAAALVRKPSLSPRLLRALWDEHGG